MFSGFLSSLASQKKGKDFFRWARRLGAEEDDADAEPRLRRRLLRHGGLARREALGTASSRHITLSKARSRLDQRRFSRPNTHFAALIFFRKL